MYMKVMKTMTLMLLVLVYICISCYMVTTVSKLKLRLVGQAGDMGSSEDEDDSGKSDAESKKNNANQIPKKVSTPTKPTLAQKKALAMVNRKPLSKPIGRPHSPSLHNVKRERNISSASSSRASSPVHRGSLSPTHPSSQPDNGARKRQSSEISDGENETKRMRKAAGSASPPHRATSPAAHTATAAADGSADTDLITEAEVINALRGKRLTTKEFLSVFRKRLKKDRNKDIITGLLKKLARHVDSGNPKEKLLELKPEYQ